MKSSNFMIIPSLSCQASCNYCFGPYEGEVINEETAKETINFIHNISETSQDKVSITFHGGEPLLAPIKIWKVLLNEIEDKLSSYNLELSVQSNLWNLDNDFLDLFIEYNVSISTSIDGPKEVCDINRGKGYFDKTFSSINLARSRGCNVGAIATVSSKNLYNWEESLKFFKNNGLSLVLHGAIPSLNEKKCFNNNKSSNNRQSEYVLNPSQYSNLIKDMFSWYVENSKKIDISTLNQYVKGIVHRNPGVCTFCDCFGMFLAIAPNGDITACQRFATMDDFKLGNIFDKPTLEEIYKSENGIKHLEREKKVAKLCGDCDFYDICKGGCYYNAVAANSYVDPYCKAYKEIYTFVQDKVIEEVGMEDNINAMLESPPRENEHPLFRKGKYISLADKVHPFLVADNARNILALYELSKTNDPKLAANNLFDNKICGEPKVTEQVLSKTQDHIANLHYNLNNCYIYFTYNCNLRCTHCHAHGGENTEEMEIANYEKVVKEAIESNFQKIVIVGGEPLIHSQKEELFKVSEKYRGKGTNLVLRTNLTLDLTKEDFIKIAKSFDQVVVSVDGSKETHNNRRGEGTYQKTVKNLKKYVKYSKNISNHGELSLACVMNSEDINGKPGDSVRKLRNELGVKRLRFNPLLPLGRASYLEKPVISEGLMEHVSPEEMLKKRVSPLTSCGIGQNIQINPDGSSYPCYAWCGEHTFIANVFEKGLKETLKSKEFIRLSECTVDTIEKCKDCEYRYFCGGTCKAWGNQNTLDLNAPPVECEHLQQKAEKLIESAYNYLKN